MVRYCHNCGHEIKDNEHFCSKCGQKAIDRNPTFDNEFNDENKKIKSSFQSKNDNNLNNNIDNNQVKYNSHKNDKWKSGLLIFVTIIIVLICAFALISGNINSNSNSNSDYNYDSSSDFNSDYLDNGYANQTGHFTINIENGTYLNGIGSSKMIDYNYSVIESFENFTISGYETYKVDLNDGNWFIIDIYKIDYNTPADNWVYNSETDEDGLSYIFYNTKGEYHGYFINIPDSSDNSTYQSSDFLTGIFHRSDESY